MSAQSFVRSKNALNTVRSVALRIGIVRPVERNLAHVRASRGRESDASRRTGRPACRPRRAAPGRRVRSTSRSASRPRHAGGKQLEDRAARDLVDEDIDVDVAGAARFGDVVGERERAAERVRDLPRRGARSRSRRPRSASVVIAAADTRAGARRGRLREMLGEVEHLREPVRERCRGRAGRAPARSSSVDARRRAAPQDARERRRASARARRTRRPRSPPATSPARRASSRFDRPAASRAVRIARAASMPRCYRIR